MGIYLNPKSKRFAESIASKIYVDKSGLIAYTNSVMNTEQKYICVSRPRRFGKSMAVGMLAAYYGCMEDTSDMFDGLKITQMESYKKYLNQCEVICVNMQEFLSRSKDIPQMLELFQKKLTWELTGRFPEVRYFDREDLIEVLNDIYAAVNHTFVILIDEWDSIFREYERDRQGQKQYLDFLRAWLKDKPYVALAYMTGILPVKKYGSHSALNMFTEFSMTNPKGLAEYVGFTGEEVKRLCDTYGMDFEKMKAWYDGYTFESIPSVYSPKSVVEALNWKSYDTYWNQTETYEALKIYIQMNFDGLKDAVVEMLAGGRVRINTGTFSNDMTTFASKDDVLTLLIHLGYLAYHGQDSTVFIPNKEISNEYINAIEGAHWKEIVGAVKQSEYLLQALWSRDEKAVADGIAEVHMSTSILRYNSEDALSYTVGLAFYAAREYYTVIREMPAGKGFADICFLPRPNYAHKPAVIVELKWNKDTEGAIAQIRDKGYVKALEAYKGKLLLTGINYNRNTKKHECKIECIEV